MRSTEEIRRRKKSKQVVQLNMLLLGPPGIGKETFLNNLRNNNFNHHSNNNDCSVEYVEKYVEKPLNFEYETVQIENEASSPIMINVAKCDTMNLINNSSVPKKIKDHIELQFSQFLNDEIKVQRDKQFNKGSSDRRLHCCLYIVDGNANRLQQFDIDLLKELHSLVNVVMIIGKADKYNEKELETLKFNIKDDINRNKIQIFKYGDDYLDDIFEDSSHLLINDLQPFSIICGDKVEEKSGKVYRHHGCGKLYIEDSSISDLTYLKGIILESHLQELKDITNDILYEKFRTKVLLERQNDRISLRSDSFERRTEVTPATSDESPLLIETKLVDPKAFNKGELFGKELQEKNKIIEAYQRRIGDLEKILENSANSSPTTKIGMNELERML